MMNIIMLGLSVGTPVLVVVSFVAGAVFSYLFLRANPNKKAKLDSEVTKFKNQNDV